MKVITGTLRGRNLETPKGMDTRPTTSKVKESIFNIVQFDIEGREVLDLFAGSGQLGIEAISRGAKSCVFCDVNKSAVEVINRNIEKCDIKDKARVYNKDGVAFASTSGKNSFELIFLDPPYGNSMLNDAIKAITTVDICQVGGIILCESHKSYEIDALPLPYRILKEYMYGEKKITTIIKGE